MSEMTVLEMFYCVRMNIRNLEWSVSKEGTSILLPTIEQLDKAIAALEEGKDPNDLIFVEDEEI